MYYIRHAYVILRSGVCHSCGFARSRAFAHASSQTFKPVANRLNARATHVCMHACMHVCMHGMHAPRSVCCLTMHTARMRTLTNVLLVHAVRRLPPLALRYPGNGPRGTACDADWGERLCVAKSCSDTMLGKEDKFHMLRC